MSRYNATYYYNGSEYPATVTLLKDKLSIQFDHTGTTAQVYWYYDQIKQKEAATHAFDYPGYPPQTLVVLAAETADALQARMQQSSRKIRIGRMAPLLKVALLVCGFLVLAYLFLVPWAAGLLAKNFPLSYEKSLGEQVFASMKGDFKIDEERTAYVNSFFNQLHFSSPYAVQITVVKSDVANAFALPGGRIVVYDKILQGMRSYEELAALLAHEFVHVRNRHTLRSIFRQMGSRIFLALLIGDAGAVSAVVINNADNLKSLSYSRSLEKEADEEGAQLLAQRRINCTGFVHLFQLLKKEAAGLQPSEWLSSHPDLERRIQNIRENNFCKGAKAATDSTLHTLFLKIKTAE